MTTLDWADAREQAAVGPSLARVRCPCRWSFAAIVILQVIGAVEGGMVLICPWSHAKHERKRLPLDAQPDDEVMPLDRC
jgi:hypothetical protein